MTARILPFPNRSGVPAIPQGEPCIVVKLRTPRECPKIALLRRNTRRLCKNFNWQFSGSES